MNPTDGRLNARRFEHRRSAAEDGVRWPGGAALALSVVLNIEEGAELSVADGDATNEAVHEITHRVDGAPDFCMGTHFEFGARVGHLGQRFQRCRIDRREVLLARGCNPLAVDVELVAIANGNNPGALRRRCIVPARRAGSARVLVRRGGNGCCVLIVCGGHKGVLDQSMVK